MRISDWSSDVCSSDLPKSLSATVHAESFSGHLRAPGVAIDKPRFGPGSSFEHSYGSGSGEIGMETFSGSAELLLRYGSPPRFHRRFHARHQAGVALWSLHHTRKHRMSTPHWTGLRDT